MSPSAPLVTLRQRPIRLRMISPKAMVIMAVASTLLPEAAMRPIRSDQNTEKSTLPTMASGSMVPLAKVGGVATPATTTACPATM